MKQKKRPGHTIKEHAHLVGIKGVAMAALAVYLSEDGFRVTGSDVADTFPTDDELKRIGISVMAGFSAAHVTGENTPDTVYYTGAHGGRDNPEVLAAVAAGIPVLPHGAALGNIMTGTRQIVVAGSHGKTTTSAMIAALLIHAKRDPSYAIGCGAIIGLGAAGHKGTSDWFVAEGDEYVTDPGHDRTPRFMWLHPEILTVTNIDFDHPDAYTDLEAVQAAFKFLQNQSKITIVNADDAGSSVLRTAKNVVTYGYSPASDVRIVHVGVGNERMFFRLEERGVFVGEFALKIPGKHNVANATAALIAAHTTGIGWDVLRDGLLTFRGTKRRFEKLGTAGGVTVYDDYAHHPAEIRATLAAARMWFPDKRIVAVFQPHTYSRTKALLSEFSRSFGDANSVILTDIYASAREHETLGISGATLVSETSKLHAHVLYGKGYTEVASLLKREVRTGDIVICMGAGDIYTWGPKYLASLG